MLIKDTTEVPEDLPAALTNSQWLELAIAYLLETQNVLSKTGLINSTDEPNKTLDQHQPKHYVESVQKKKTGFSEGAESEGKRTGSSVKSRHSLIFFLQENAS